MTSNVENLKHLSAHTALDALIATKQFKYAASKYAAEVAKDEYIKSSGDVNAAAQWLAAKNKEEALSKDIDLLRQLADELRTSSLQQV